MNANIAKNNMSAYDFINMSEMIEDETIQTNIIYHVLIENQIHDYDNIIHDDFITSLDTDSDGHVEFNGFDSEGYIEHYKADKNTDGSWSYEAEFKNTPMIHMSDDEVKTINEYFKTHEYILTYNAEFGSAPIK